LPPHLQNTRGLIERKTAPQIKSNSSKRGRLSAKKLQPLLEDFSKKTSAEANQALSHIDTIVGEKPRRRSPGRSRSAANPLPI